MKHYEWYQGNNSYTISLDALNNVKCDTCSVPFIIAETVRFMRVNSLKKVVLDSKDAIYLIA